MEGIWSVSNPLGHPRCIFKTEEAARQYMYEQADTFFSRVHSSGNILRSSHSVHFYIEETPYKWEMAHLITTGDE